ncbi:TetR/AcrR family transcriptional regulator [Pseudoroseicyclus tamaricis]|uniref:TetR family transcriptional regulator n=1 Tax=Pseudoroseicyclus tamaricis TaxID=2705421 RepID=A0A6B2JQ15_9RHOB|nr:TetR family transcriptional regulator C-terminal domain-containing protein [Pseudoroseicyclus tamaricis]NDV00208.1 TetR family transcriptional regulator [Pseudoroseicyclus tamaricis]
MTTTRRAYRRESPANRRQDLVDATLTLLAEAGPEAATVRAIAERAGVTQGMIRHHFNGKDALVNAAYQAHMAALSEAIAAQVAAAGPSATARLTAMIRASVTPPVAESTGLSLWAGFLHLVRQSPAMAVTHEASYLAYRDQLQALLVEARQEAGNPLPEEEARALAIASNAVIDGLWLEAGALPEAFSPGEIFSLALASVGTLAGLTLTPS